MVGRLEPDENNEVRVQQQQEGSALEGTDLIVKISATISKINPNFL